MDSQKEELMLRFRELIPTTAADERFVLNFGYVDEKPLPVVYLKEDETPDSTMPRKYLLILKKGEDEFAIRLVGFFDMVHFIVPVEWWPHYVNAKDLDRLVVEIFEGWLKTIDAVKEMVKRHSGPDLSSEPL